MAGAPFLMACFVRPHIGLHSVSEGIRSHPHTAPRRQLSQTKSPPALEQVLPPRGREGWRRSLHVREQKPQPTHMCESDQPLIEMLGSAFPKSPMLLPASCRHAPFVTLERLILLRIKCWQTHRDIPCDSCPIGGGIVMRSALAVFRLTTSSKAIGMERWSLFRQRLEREKLPIFGHSA